MESDNILILIEQHTRNVVDFLITDLKRELIDQGHILTGALRDSIELVSLIKTKDSTEAIVMLERYYEALETGVPARSIKFQRGSGKGHSRYIDALVRFWEIKAGLSGDEALRAAFALATKHKKEGMPTQSSWKYSANKRRLAFFSHVIDNSKHVDNFEDRLQLALEDVAERLFDKFQIKIL